MQAYVWFPVSAAQGDKIGRTNRNMVSKLLITGQLEEGQKISTKCLESGYRIVTRKFTLSGPTQRAGLICRGLPVKDLSSN